MLDSVLKNLIRVGIVSSASPEACTARVAFGDRSSIVSYDLPVLVRGALQNKDYWLPDPGEQVVCLFLPSGNAQGFILGSLYSAKDAPPVSSRDKRHIKFSDGTTVEYDRGTHTMSIDAKGPINIIATGPVNLTSDGIVEITASGVTVNADLTINGEAVVTGDATAGGISLKTHVHSGVTTGSGNTGAPVGGA